MKHWWKLSTEHPDMCNLCHVIKSFDGSDEDNCPGKPPKTQLKATKNEKED